MRPIGKTILAFVLATATFTSWAHTPEVKKEKKENKVSEAKLNHFLIDQIDDIDMEYFNLKEVSATLTIKVGMDGKIEVLDVKGESCFINNYIKIMLEKEDVLVEGMSPGTTRTLNVKYVRV
ncbi:MAG: hypothetical protein LPK80_03345 [Bacteroidota bacterium]|nr:hypothetical protein [Bacteroidota bacterium]MDX5340466.1 hypothetical protein [Cyclobacteriaceae bacterium]MDX5404522.1 hypothetical protein [Bacteroidota bacterium]